MLSWLNNGYSLYVTMQVYSNFMSLKDGVYTKEGGSKKGGHLGNLLM